MKKGKAPGKDGVTSEEIKAGGDTLINALRALFNACLNHKKLPTPWHEAQLILLFKKGDRSNIENYRPLSLLSNTYKLFISIIGRRIENALNADISETQAGFRKNMSTLDHIFVAKQLIRRAHDYKFPLVLVFVDFKKAFDSVYSQSVIQVLEDSGIHDAYVALFNDVYKNASLEVALDKEKRKIEVKRGIRQGDVLSGKLFIKALESACNKLNWGGKGVNINGKRISMLKFADDILILAHSTQEAKEMITELIEETQKIGLQINSGKTKYISINIDSEGKLRVGNGIIEEVEEYIYLGSLINANEREAEKEIGRRITQGWRCYNKYRHLFRSDVSMEAKRNLWLKCVMPVMLYGVETWAMPEKVIKKMRVAQRMMERSMLRITRKDRKSNRLIRKETMLKDIGVAMLERKWNWAGHIARVKDERLTKEMISWYPRHLSRCKGRPSIRWDEEMRKCCGGVTWQRVANDRKEWDRMRKVFCEEWLCSN